MKKINKIIAVLIFAITISSIVSAQTIINDNQKVYGTWTKSGSPYIIKGEAIVPVGKTLNIDAGVTVKFYTGEEEDCGMLRINGQLDANGSKNNMIIFTRDGYSGNWGIILFENSNNSTMKYSKIEYGNSISNITTTCIESKNAVAVLTINNSYVKISNCKITNNNATAIFIECSDNSSITNTIIAENGYTGFVCKASNPELINCNILNNGGDGVFLSQDSEPLIKNCIIYNNSGDNFDIHDGSGANPKVYYSLLEDNLPTEVTNYKNNIINQNPQLNNDYSLKSNSPCKNTGENNVDIGVIFSQAPTNNSGQENGQAGKVSGNNQNIEIIDDGNIYSTLTEDCLNWPSDEIMRKARKTEWEKYSYYPTDGDRGVIIGEFQHCAGHIIYIIKIDNKYYVPIKKEGVTIIGDNQSGQQFDYSPTITIVYAGHIYSTLPNDCLNWPSDEIMQKARNTEWEKYGYYPSNGDEGIIIGEFQHCAGHMIYIVKIDNKYYVPIKKEGVTKY